MGDLYLHLGFARRARFADGLHPIAVEALVRSPGAVILGATLPSLPDMEHKGASFFRRLFMPGKQKRAFWTKALEPAGSPSLELALAIMEKAKGARPGGMARFALGLGVLSHQVLHARVGDVTASLEGAQRDAMRRALARTWLVEALPRTDVLATELKATLALEDNAQAYKPLVEHLNGALREAHGDAPGTETLWRWLKGLCAEVGPLVDRATLPPSLGVSDDEARDQHGEALFAAVEDARRWLVLLANQLAPLFLGGDPAREEMRRALVDDSDALLRPNADEEMPPASRFHDGVVGLREEHLARGRNPKPAWDEVSGATERAHPAGMPPVPEDASGPLPRVPAHTQEVSVADIEAEVAPPGFAAPAHTQEVSVAQIEEQLGALATSGSGAATGATPPPAPTSTQQVSLDDIQEELAAAAPSAGPPPAPTSTQQVSLEDIQEELANATVPPPQAPGAPFLAGAVPVPPPAAPSTTPASAPEETSAQPPTSAEPESAEHANGAAPVASAAAAQGDGTDAATDAATVAAVEGEGPTEADATEAEPSVREGTDPAGV